jgi:hypothetical protein
MFGAYFHQDWDTEGDDWPDLVCNYLGDTSIDAAATADEIDRLLAEGDTEERLAERLLHEFGCYYYVHHEAAGPGFRAWLGQVASMLRASGPNLGCSGPGHGGSLDKRTVFIGRAAEPGVRRLNGSSLL